MSFSAAVQTVTASIASANEQLIEPLKAAMVRAALPKGEYPSPLGLIEKLRLEVGSDAARPERVASLLKSSPLTSMRLIATANSAFYARTTPVDTVLGAVNHLGMRRLQGIIEDLADKKSFQATFLGRAVGSGALQQSLVAHILAVALANILAPGGVLIERAFTLSTLLRLPTEMLGFLRPSLYSACYLDSSGDLKSTFERNFKRLMGQSTAAHAVTFAEGYSFPLAVAKMLSYLELPPWNRRGSSEDAKDSRQVAVAVFLAQRLAEEVCRFGGFIPLDSLINDLAEKASLKPADVKTAVGDMSERFFEQCLTLGLKPSRLPLYLENYRSKMVGADGKELPPNFKVPGIAERINPFLYELKACLNTRQQGQEFGFFPQALYCTLQALVRGLNFDRAVFFRYDEGENALVPTIIFGERPSELSLLPRKVNSPQQKYMPDVQSLLQHKAVFVGDPVFGEAWPLAAFPVICQGRVEGVFFADKLARKNALPLDTQEQVAIVALAEGWYDVSPDFH